MPGKGVYFQIHMTFTVPLCCVRFLVCRVGGELRNYYDVNWLHRDGQSCNLGLPGSAKLTGSLVHSFHKRQSISGRYFLSTY